MLCLEWYIDGFSRVYGKRDTAVGYYTSVLNTTLSFRNNSNNIWLWTLAEGNISHLLVADRFLEDIAKLYEPFSVYNAQHKCYLNYAVRLSNCSFDTPERNKNCSIYQYPAHHSCTKCEVRQDFSHLTLKELRKKQKEIKSKLESQMAYDIDYDQDLENSASAPPECIYVRRSIERLSHLIDVYDGDKRILHEQYGYKIDTSKPYLKHHYDIYHLSGIDLMHVMFSSCGHVGQFMKHLVRSAPTDVFRSASSILSTCTKEKFKFEDIDDWDCQKMERAAFLAPIAFEGILDNYEILEFVPSSFFTLKILC